MSIGDLIFFFLPRNKIVKGCSIALIRLVAFYFSFKNVLKLGIAKWKNVLYISKSGALQNGKKLKTHGKCFFMAHAAFKLKIGLHHHIDYKFRHAYKNLWGYQNIFDKKKHFFRIKGVELWAFDGMWLLGFIVGLIQILTVQENFKLYYLCASF